MTTSKRTLDIREYTVAWICPLKIEQVAAMEMLDEEHNGLPQPDTDHNAYTLGNIENYNIVIASLPRAGNNSAATVVANMTRTFPNLKYGLLVGIGGGVPKQTDAGPIKLGHIVVSLPTRQDSGAIQIDHGKAEHDKFVRIGSIPAPPNALVNAAQKMEAVRERLKKDPLQAHLRRIDTTTRGLQKYKHPGPDSDHLYRAEYIHENKTLTCAENGCDARQILDRSTKDDIKAKDEEEWLTIHRGTIASGELVMRNGLQRDRLAQEHDVLCFEMEAAGALNDFPCLVIRGISDYSDSHKSDKWQGYAAAVAAAYARELFSHMPIYSWALDRFLNGTPDPPYCPGNRGSSSNGFGVPDDVNHLLTHWHGIWAKLESDVS